MDKKLLHFVELKSKTNHKYKIEFWGGEVAEVQILDYPTNALKTLAIATRGYKGNYTLDPMSEEEMKLFAAEIQKTPLATPIEFLNFVFLLNDVPRSFTHQLVRTRIGAAYVQESTRFLGAQDVYKVLVPETAIVEDTAGSLMPNQDYLYGIVDALTAYENALPDMSSQDARQLFPHAVLTSVFWSINMKALMHVYNQRWCCCAESSSWLPVMRAVKTLIKKKCGDTIGSMLTAPIDRGESCGFNSKLLDQPCKWLAGGPR